MTSSVLLLRTSVSICVAGAMASALAAQAAGAWTPLFNGRDLTGWTVAVGRGRTAPASASAPAPAAAPAPAPAPPASWKVEDGAIVGGQGGGRGSLVTDRKYRDFDLDLEFQLAEHGAQCSADHDAAGADRACMYNSGVTFRTGYQVNLGRREAGEYIGVVVHRASPQAIRGNVLWLDKGDDKFPNLRKRGEWNRLQIAFTGTHLQVRLNGTQICDVIDDPTDPAEAAWKEAAPISLQWPPASEAGGFVGFVKYRNIRIREL